MNRHKRGLWLVPFVLVLLGVLVWFGWFAPAGKAFQLYDRVRKTVVFSAPIHAGDKLRLEIEHSAEHIPWFEYYTVREDDQFNLDAIAVARITTGNSGFLLCWPREVQSSIRVARESWEMPFLNAT